MTGLKLSASQAASQVGTDPKTLRKFLRDPNTDWTAVGQGGRYEFREEEIPDLKQKFEAWSTSRPKRSAGAGTTAVPRARRARTRDTEPTTPIDGDDPITRITSSIAHRVRRHGMVCNWRLQTKTGTVIELCRNAPVEGEKYCTDHQQQVYCGEPVDPKCGPAYRTPYCKYHNGDISEEEFEQLTSE